MPNAATIVDKTLVHGSDGSGRATSATRVSIDIDSFCARVSATLKSRFFPRAAHNILWLKFGFNILIDATTISYHTAKQQAAPISFLNGKVRPMPKITIKFLGLEVSAQGVLSVVLASVIALTALAVIWAYLEKRDLPRKNSIASQTQRMI